MILYIITNISIISVKLGIAPIAWSNDDMPELGGDTPLEQCLSEASEAGFSGIESGGKFPKKSEELIPFLQKHNLKLSSGWYSANLRKNSVKDEIILIQEQLKLFQDCKAPCIVFAEVSDSIAGDPNRPLSSRPQMNKDEWNEYCKKISEMGKYLEEQDMPLAYHHHMGTVIETEDDTKRLLDNTSDQVKLILDTGHMLFAKGNSVKIAEDYKDRIIHIHCKDMREDILNKSLQKDWSFRKAFLEGAFTVPGDECIDYKPLLKYLKNIDYKGWLVVEAEQDPAKANPLEYAKKGFKYLSKMCADIDLKIAL